MSDHSLCQGYDHQPQCRTCWRNPANHPYAQNDAWQAWFLPAPSDDCAEYVSTEERK